MFQHSGSWTKICESYYKRKPANLRYNYLPVFTHYLVHMDAMFKQTKCINCNKISVTDYYYHCNKISKLLLIIAHHEFD